ncbi:DinB family protein [Gilvibacter sediminis]|uniref:DinB family protein n=1 Tax=Gilvibacter sediminis TaxID=379071 RepID=UPI002350AEB7|nr:DinB family protein [Gilvibacter sediminis]MDC7997151.1 DinB family protein [Gilvibacter sediminis]
MKTTSEALITDLIARVQENLNGAQALKQEAEEALNWKAGPKVWSALECFEHMNQYSDVYLMRIMEGMTKSNKKPQEEFKSGGLGNWFAKLMSPGDAGTKMKTFKSKDPNGKKLPVSVIDTYIQDQEKSLALLQIARSKNLARVKVPTDLGAWAKVKLGDAFRIIVYHNQRHLQQAQRSFEGYVNQTRLAQG